MYIESPRSVVLQSLAHKLSFRKGEPELVGLALVRGIDAGDDPLGEFLPKLYEIGSHEVGIGTTARWSIDVVERKVSVPRHGKALEGECVQDLDGL